MVRPAHFGDQAGTGICLGQPGPWSGSLNSFSLFGTVNGESKPCNPGGVIAVHANRFAMLHWRGLHCAEPGPASQPSVPIPVDAADKAGPVPRRVDRSSLESMSKTGWPFTPRRAL